MHTMKLRWFYSAVVITTGLALELSAAPKSQDMYPQLPLAFEPLPGLTSAGFSARGRGYQLTLSPNGDLRLALAGKGTVGIRFVGSSGAMRLQPEGLLAAKTNYIVGHDSSRWRVGVPNYARLRATGLYKGIDAVYYSRAGELEYDLNIAPGANPDLVRLQFSGQRDLSVDSNGDLIIGLGTASIRQKTPYAFQTVNGIRRRIETAYEVIRPNLVRLRVAKFERTRPLVIDPVLIYSTYFGTHGADGSYALAVDSEGNAYIAGITDSSALRTTAGAFQSGFKGLTDAFVTKFNAAGNAVIFTTYYGGSLNEGATGVAVDSDGDVYIAGTTQSSDLPMTPGAFQTTYHGGETVNDTTIMGDGFVAKFDPSGSKLIYATYLGGSQAEMLFGLALDLSGNAIVTGVTLSHNFPVTPNALQSSYHGSTDGFVTKLNATGSAAIFSTFLGGTNLDGPERLVTDPDGNIYIVGTTVSSDFPTTPGAYQTTAKGGPDAFALKLSPQGTLIFSTLLGTPSLDQGRSIAIDSAGNVYVLGQTSAATGFPITAGAAQAQYAGGITDGFVAKFDPTGSRLLYCTYFGGEGDEDIGSIAVDASGNAYATLKTTSQIFPTTPDALQPKSGGAADAFIGVINPGGTAFLYKSFLGGSGNDIILALALDAVGNLYISGFTNSTDFPTVNGSYNPIYSGGANDAVLTKIQFVAPDLTASSSSVSFASVSGAEAPAPQTISIASTADPLHFTVSVSPLATWLNVAASTNETPATLTFAVDSRNLSPGTYSTNLTLTAAAPSTAVLTIPVTLNVAANPNPLINTTGIVNAATSLGGPVAPGLIVTLYGSRLGPQQAAGAEVTTDGRLATAVAETSVLFDGHAAPLVSVSANQISAVVPYEVDSQVATQVQVVYQNRFSNVVSMPIVATAPGIFTVNSSGKGPGVIYNQDGSLNSASHPAEKGSVVVLYATGEGDTDPPGVDGKLAVSVYPKPVAPISLKIGGSTADLIYAGAAPGLTAGLMQINATVPAGARSGVVPVVLMVGGNSSPATVTISIK